MTSTFFGFETARRAMQAQQNALYTTGHNISNANTEGYTRQRVAFTQSEAYPGVGRNRPNIPGQIGTGVNSEQIERVRNKFLDVQFRDENNKASYYQSKANSLQKLEEVMNEPTDKGLSNTMNRFWSSLQDLSANPADEGTRAVVKERAIALTESFHYLSNSIESIQTDTKNEIQIGVDQVNSVATQLNDLNDQIRKIEINGYTPNDLYDKRDLLLNELSQFVNFETTKVGSGGLASPSAEGLVTVDIPGLGIIVDGTDTTTPPPVFDIQFDGVNGSVKTISLGTTTNTADSWSGNGKINGLIDTFGYENASGQEVGDFPDMMSKLDNLAYTFAEGFNAVHQAGMSLVEINSGTPQPINFFEPDTTSTTRADYAKNITISTDILSDLDYIAAADSTTPLSGDGSNAIKLANVKDNALPYNPLGAGDSFESYYIGVIGTLGVESQEAQRLSANSETLKEAVQIRKDSVSSVSLDEEMANMVKFQHAYNAGARIMTTMDEILDKVINGMGRVGR
ncbi:flagellar hook-associated protein FlgK (plasmid) [Rossellomorea sp. AcN35-11]|nr:flagellar hook-associated protein FlgK [Rossellomorea aquimaris]WJV32343.1 flagellar hook-associated protein FlgK [Rossellomorea sp. AcN35-11]